MEPQTKTSKRNESRSKEPIKNKEMKADQEETKNRSIKQEATWKLRRTTKQFWLHQPPWWPLTFDLRPCLRRLVLPRIRARRDLELVREAPLVLWRRSAAGTLPEGG